MARIPDYSRRQVGIRPVSAQGFSMRAPDASGLARGLEQVESGVMQRVEVERQKVNVAATMEADRKFSEWRINRLFNPEGGIYSRKGKAALNLTDESMAEYDKTYNEIARTLTPPQKERFEQLNQPARQRYFTEINRHVFQERQSYFETQRDASIDNAIQSSGYYWNDPEMLRYNQTKIDVLIADKARSDGLPPEEFERRRQIEYNRLHTNVLQQMMVRDPAKAQSYFIEHAQELSPELALKAAGDLKTFQTRQLATGVSRALLGTGKSGSLGVLSRMRMQESGDRQFDQGGNPITSPKGATGVMQLMPATAPEAAELAGLPWDEELFNRPMTGNPALDEQAQAYNQALGEAYFGAQLKKYGSEALAAAAYNAGPGNLDKWLQEYGDPRKGEISSAEFMSKIPFKETRDYVRAVVGTPGESTASAGSASRANILAEIAQLPTDIRKLVDADVQAAWKAEDQAYNSMFEQAADQMRDGQTLTSIDPMIWSQLTNDDKGKLERDLARLTKGEDVQTDWGFYEDLLSMPVEQLANLSLARDIRPRLSNTEFGKAEGLWSAARNGETTTRDRLKHLSDIKTRYMTEAGIKAGNAKDALTSSNLRKRDLFNRELESQVSIFQADHQRLPNADEYRTLLYNVTAPFEYKQEGDWTRTRKPLFEVPVSHRSQARVDTVKVDLDAMPPQERADIEESLALQGIDNPTDKQIRETYALLPELKAGLMRAGIDPSAENMADIIQRMNEMRDE